MKHKTRSLSKLLFSVLACLCVLSLLTSSTFGTVVPEFTDYETTEVSIPLSFQNKTDQTGFVYNDSMLLGNNQEFSPELAKISVILATAAYKWENLQSALDQLGCEYPGYIGDPLDPGYQDSKGNWSKAHTFDDNDFVRYVIASRDAGDYRIYFVVVQGTSGSYDWLSNFNIGEDDDHAGFYLAHDEIMTELNAVMAQDGHSPDTRIVLATGHSRGAAVSNIVAGELTDGVSPYVSPSRVFGYHFACPKVSRRSAVKNSGYNNIYVFNNKDDLVPEVPLSDWGYGTYGVNVDLALGCLDCVSSHVRTLMGSAYSGTEETATYLTGAVETLFPTASGANNVVRVVLKGLGLILKGETTDLQELLGLVGISTSAHAVDMLLKIKDLNLSKVTQYFNFVQYALGMIPQYLAETEGMTNEEFQAWFEEHRTELEEMEDFFGFNITNREDIQQLYGLIAVDVLSDFTGLGLDASAILKITTTVTVLWVYLMTVDGFQGALTAIRDAHMGPTYLYWINAMYYGYRGWYRYSGETSPVYRLDQSAIQTIGQECFAYCPRVVALSPPNTVRHLGSGVCQYASGLLNVSLPGSVVCIGSSAFHGCSGLINLSLSEGLKEIGRSAFSSCSGLTSVTIPKGGVKVYPHAFDYCTGLQTVYAPDSTLFDPARFEGSWTEAPCFSGVDATLIVTKDTGIIPDGYLRCSTRYPTETHLAGLNRIVVEEGITEIGERAFYFGTASASCVTDVTLPSTLTKIGAYAFYGNAVRTLTMPEGDPDVPFEIGAYAFYGCKNLTSVTLPEGLTAVEPYTFYGCTALAQAPIPDGIGEIGQYAFGSCTSLTAARIPAGGVKVWPQAFDNCTALQTVYAADSTKFNPARFESSSGWSETTIFSGAHATMIVTKDTGCVRDSFLGGTQPSHRMGISRIEVEEGITQIGEYAFYINSYDSSLLEIVLPSTLTKIGAYAFCGNSNPSITILDGSAGGLTEVGAYAFQSCKNLTSVPLREGLTKVEPYTFYGCSSLQEVTIPSTVTEIGESAFYGCSSLTTVTIPKGGVKVYPHAFDYCTGLQTVYAPDSTVFNPARFEEGSSSGEATIFYNANAVLIILKDTGIIPDSWLKSTAQYYHSTHMYGIVRIEVEEGITEIGEYAFSFGGSSASRITEVVLPSTVTKIGAYAFRNNSMSSITMPEGSPNVVTEIGPVAFYGCKNLTSITLPEGLTAVEPYTFEGCSGLTAITIPDRVTGIGESAFAWCKGLAEVTIPGHVTEIGSDAFFSCTGLTSVTISDSVTAIGQYAFCGCDQLKGVTIPASVEAFGYKALGYNTNGAVMSGFTIYGHGGTAAQTYAAQNSIRFVDLDTAVCPYGHTWDEGEVATPPGCVQEGVMTYTCAVCGETKTEPIPALGHDFVNGVCRRCGVTDPDAQVFSDVQPGVYCFDAVRWAMEQGITDGTSETDFSPNASCTRAQIVTMLWRAMGKPGHTGENPFTDVPAGAWYYDAVLWAVENGITDGTGDGTFSPDASCTRAQVVTFLWRAAGEPAPASAENPFADVPAGAWYRQTVLWAVNSDPQITNGVSATRFGPGRICTRAQVVTFLYRYMGQD